MSWSGKGSIPNLNRVEARGIHGHLSGTALFSGFYINELTIRLLGEHEPVPELFVAYENCLGQLAHAAGLDTALRQYELSLLRILGYGVDLEREADSGKAVCVDVTYSYETEHGLRRAQNDDLLQIRGDTLHALVERRPLDVRQSKEARQLMRHIIRYYLGNRPLRSRELFQSRQIQENS
jgi:DNA repair protein RecO (recombination protein O)